MVYFANCHMHSLFSDGAFTPEELVDLAAELGHRALILTDHDTIRGTYRFQKAARKKGILSVMGCEFTVVGLGADFHLVGLDFNPYDPDIQRLLTQGALKQTSRSKLLYQWGIERGTLPGNLKWEEIEAAFPENDYLCNDQVFAVLKLRGLCSEEEQKSLRRANFSYLDTEREQKIVDITGMHYPQLEDVVRIVRKAGGVPVVAHPHGQIEYAERLVEMGVMGFETRHPMLTEEEKSFFDQFCDKRNLYKMGGTDHNSILGGPIPNGKAPDSGGVTEEDFMKLYRRELG